MGRDTIHLLIVEDSYEYAQMLKTVLLAEETVNFDIAHCENLHEALNCLHQGDFETILLDLSLPDSLGLDTFLVIHDEVPDIPIVVITALDDASVAIRAVRHGAQDYLVKGDLDVSNLVRSLRYAVERQHTLMMIEQRTLIDDLTGLYNRRGFMQLALQQLKLSRRKGTNMLLVFADLDNLKGINDAHGHHEGDHALRDAAAIFRKTFRETDILARVGGDEFAILALDVQENSGVILNDRLHRNLEAYRTENQRNYHLSLSWGLTLCQSEQVCTLEELLERADSSMYEQKRKKKASINQLV